MIPERNMKQAKRIDNGEWEKGFLFPMWCGEEIFCISTEPISANDYGEIYSYCYHEVDPATVEDVAVKPKWVSKHDSTIAYCQNCDNDLSTGRNNELAKYCENCGLRIDWED